MTIVRAEIAKKSEKSKILIFFNVKGWGIQVVAPRPKKFPSDPYHANI